MRLQNFTKIDAWVWISICPPHTNRQKDKQTNICTTIFIKIDLLYQLSFHEQKFPRDELKLIEN